MIRVVAFIWGLFMSVFDSGQSVYSFLLLHCKGVVLALKFSFSLVIVQAELSSVHFCTRKSFSKVWGLFETVSFHRCLWCAAIEQNL